MWWVEQDGGSGEEKVETIGINWIESMERSIISRNIPWTRKPCVGVCVCVCVHERETERDGL